MCSLITCERTYYSFKYNFIFGSYYMPFLGNSIRKSLGFFYLVVLFYRVLVCFVAVIYIVNNTTEYEYNYIAHKNVTKYNDSDYKIFNNFFIILYCAKYSYM